MNHLETYNNGSISVNVEYQKTEFGELFLIAIDGKSEEELTDSFEKRLWQEIKDKLPEIEYERHYENQCYQADHERQLEKEG